MENIEKIDIEPTWEGLCNMAIAGAINPGVLMNACKIADTIRRSQKAGASWIHVTFPVEGEMLFVDDLPSIGDTVAVCRMGGDLFGHDFQGRVDKISGDIFVIVDQEGDSWDCKADQLTVVP